MKPITGNLNFSGTIKDLSSEGLGVVSHPDGMTFFVPGAWPGDAGEFTITQKEKRYGFAKWNKQTEFSQARVESPCAHLGFEDGKCGGCPWIFVNYEAQLEYKDKLLAVLFKKQQIEITPEKIYPSEKQLGFRNRAQFKTDGKQVGYISPKSRTLAPVKDCVVLSEPARDILKYLNAQLPKKAWAPEGRFQWNYIDVDEDMKPEDIRLNARRPFRQANRGANTFMRDWVQKQIQNFSTEDKVLELFCGSGNFTEVLSEHFDWVTAVELPGEATHALKKKNLSGVRIVEQDINAKILWPELVKNAEDTKLLFLDPPREGFPDLALLVSKLPALERIVYVSCDPQSFAMNTKPLLTAGWTLKQVQPVDQFPHTPHVELMSVLERQK
ncbi:MAG: class I SAM-dependent RNA methyltransferase [Bdellovibrionaceae bacterium]|nr:class I SAM-dependent RNA methyltransferase [Pseudobdellovibrionaceae bacterium]